MESWINYLFALGAAFCWAISAPVLNIGFRRISKAESRGKLWTIGLCTVIAMTMGSLLLGATLIALQQPLRVLGSPAVIAAGLFTFPIATGFYYLASLSLSAQTQVASLFAKVKPLFSIALAVFVLKQGLVLTEYLAVGFIVLGLFAFSRGLKLGLGAFNGLTLGLASAAAWALGELFVDIGFDGSANLSNSFQALVSATILSAGLILVLKPKVIPDVISPKLFLPFMFHGVVSFAIGYTLFFTSIVRIGMVKSVIIVAFWPLLSLILTGIINRIQDRENTVSPMVWLSACLFAAASAIQIF